MASDCTVAIDNGYGLFDKMYKDEEFDQIERWIFENEWSYNDELADIIKQSIK